MPVYAGTHFSSIFYRQVSHFDLAVKTTSAVECRGSPLLSLLFLQTFLGAGWQLACKVFLGSVGSQRSFLQVEINRVTAFFFFFFCLATVGKHFQNIRDIELLGLNMSLGLELSWELHKGNCKNSKVKSSQHMVKSHFPKSPANDKSLSRKPPKGLNFQTQMCLGDICFLLMIIV